MVLYVRKLFGGAWSLLVGLSITIREFGHTLFKRKAVTLQYPHEKPKLSPAYRSAIKLIRFDETNSHDCVACLACERICPSFCISIEGGKVEGIKKKRATKFEMDFALCSLCGLCLDVCPTTTLEYSKFYDEAGYNREWTFDLLEEFRDYEEQFVGEQLVREEKAAEAKKKKAAAAKAAKEAKKKKAAEAKAAEEAKAKAADAPTADGAEAKADAEPKKADAEPKKADAEPKKADAEPKKADAEPKKADADAAEGGDE